MTTEMTSDVAERFISQSRQKLSEHLIRIERCVELLTDEQVWWRPNEASNSIGNLLLHLAGNIRQYFISGLGGTPDTRNRPQEFGDRAQLPKAELLAKLKATVTEADAVLAGFDREKLLEQRHIQNQDWVVLDAVYQITGHLMLHTGQIMLITKTLTAKDLGLTRLK